jgi:hypothetical protein
MKKIIIFILLLSSFALKAQSRFVVQNATGATVYNTLDSALNYSVSGDTVYIPGGAFNMGNYQLSKKLHITGVGHYADSSTATSITSITGNFYFLTGSSGSVLHGIYLSGDVRLGTNGSNMQVNDIQVIRSNIAGVVLSMDTYTNNPSSSGHLISESVIRNTVHILQTQNVLIEKSILQGAIQSFNGNLYVRNCIFTGVEGCPGYNVNGTSALFENNIFYNNSFGCGGNPLVYSTSCIYNNNLFTSGITVPSGTNIGAGNITNHPQATVFVNHSGTTFSYSSNFHLNPACTGINAATDGTDIGLYGTTNPYKEGAVPFNPHIIQSNVSTSTNASGEVNVQIKVSAQTK